MSIDRETLHGEYAGSPTPLDFFPGSVEQTAQLSKTRLINRTQYPYKIVLFSLAVLLASGICEHTQSSAKTTDHRESASFSPFSEKALREIIKEKRGNVLQDYIFSVSKGVNVRTSPNIPQPGEVPNTVAWEDITILNGVNIQKIDSFMVLNPLIVNSYPIGPNQDPWLAFEAQQRGILGGRKVVYINWGKETEDSVKRVKTDAVSNTTSPSGYIIGAIIPK